MSRKPLLFVGIGMIGVGGLFTLVVGILRASNVKLSQAGFDGDSSLLAGIVVVVLGLVVSVYATARLKVDLGPVDIETPNDAPAAQESQANDLADGGNK